jgi:hypothetical protein
VSEPCPQCGTVMRISRGRRIKVSRSVAFMVPTDLEFPVCDGCGAEWLTSSQIDVMSDAEELARSRSESAKTKETK